MTGPRAYAHVAGRLFNRPLALPSFTAHQIVGALAPRLGVSALVDENGQALALDQAAYHDDGDRREHKPYAVLDRVAIISICGPLVHKHDWIAAMCGLTSYDRLHQQISMAAADDDVDAIWLDVDSPGGEVSGAFDLADHIYGLSLSSGGPKPIWAVLTEAAYSAAYLEVSQCDRIVAPRTGGCGSIGVIMMHQDESKFWDGRGIKVTLLTAGAHKKDGNPYEALPDTVAARWRAELEEARTLFAETVARGRGLDVKAVLDTEAQIYTSKQALELGLIDEIASEDAAWADLQAELRQAA